MGTGTGILFVFIAVMAVVFLIVGVMHLFFLLTIHRTLNRVKPENLALKPALLYLDFVPMLFFFWEIIILPRASRSVLREYESRNWPTDQPKLNVKVALALGWGTLFHWLGMGLSAGLAGIGTLIPAQQSLFLWLAVAVWVILTITSMLWMAIYIIYWVQMFTFATRIKQGWPTGSTQPGERGDYEDIDMM